MMDIHDDKLEYAFVVFLLLPIFILSVMAYVYMYRRPTSPLNDCRGATVAPGGVLQQSQTGNVYHGEKNRRTRRG